MTNVDVLPAIDLAALASATTHDINTGHRTLASATWRGEAHMVEKGKIIICLLGLGFSNASFAQSADGRKLDPPHLCSAIAAQTYESEPVHDFVLYEFENMLFRAAGVVPSDGEGEIALKVRALLNREMPRLVCSQVNFIPNNGNILKLAISRQNNAFINKVLQRWKPDFNQVDTSDGRTLLDHIAARRDQYRPEQPAWRTHQRYYDRFKAAGAKTRSELEAAGAVPSTSAEQDRLIRVHAQKAEAGSFGDALTLDGIYRGVYKIFGQKLAPDAAAAAKWRQKAEQIAIARNDPVQYLNLGYARLDEDAKAAVVWFERSAALDNPEAQFLAGRAYATGNGAPKDLERALSLMVRARGRESGSFSLLWAGSINGWLGRRDQQVIWYRSAWQQGVRASALPGYPAPADPLKSPLLQWFEDHRLSPCGDIVWNNMSCP